MEKIPIPTLNLLNTKDLENAAHVLTSAFANDPCMQYIFDMEMYPLNLAVPIHRYVIKSGIIFGYAYTTGENMEGVSVWLPPQNVYLSIWNFIRAGGLSIPVNLIKRIKIYGDYSKKIHKKLVKNSHWYLFSIGVDRNKQGKSYGVSLLKPMLNYFDQIKLPCYLETHNAKNILFYEKQGFILMDVSHLPDSSISHYAMLRNPR